MCEEQLYLLVTFHPFLPIHSRSCARSNKKWLLCHSWPHDSFALMREEQQKKNGQRITTLPIHSRPCARSNVSIFFYEVCAAIKGNAAGYHAGVGCCTLQPACQVSSGRSSFHATFLRPVGVTYLRMYSAPYEKFLHDSFTLMREKQLPEKTNENDENQIHSRRCARGGMLCQPSVNPWDSPIHSHLCARRDGVDTWICDYWRNGERIIRVDARGER